MIVEVLGGAEERPEARVVEVDDLSRLRLSLGEVTDEEAAEVLENSGLGRLGDGDTAFLDAAAVRAAAEPHAGAPDWAARWDGLIAAARREGRMSEDGTAVRVRVESAAGA